MARRVPPRVESGASRTLQPASLTPRAHRWLLVLAATGLASSAAAAWVHYRLLSEPGYTSFCDVSSTVNCTQAYLSRYGALARVPVALLGVLWFALVGVLLLVPRRVRENVPAYVFALSTLALAVVLYLAYGSFVVLRTVCPLCIATYVAVIGLFLISGGTMSSPMSQLPARAARDVRALVSSPAALALTVLLLAGAASVVAFFPRDVTPGAADVQPPALAPSATDGQSSGPALTPQQQAEFERGYLQLPIVDPGVPTEGAAVLIVKFNDYQCPPCRQTYEGFKGILAKYRASNPGQVRFVTKDFPLDPECNFNAPGGSHLAACEAAVAVRLAEARHRREAMEDWLFANQPVMTPELVRQGVREVAGVTDFDAQYARVLQQVKADIATGGALNVRSTPTFFINGRMIRGGMPPWAFDAAIAYELKQAGK
jgi:uncharacterized membrane protein/protein-disulfide isomerase